MSGPEGSEDDFAHLLPPEGPVPAPCPQCRLPGQLRVENRREWADPLPTGWPPGVDAARLALACRRCGSDFLTVTTALVGNPWAVSAGGGLAGVVAREMPWVECQQCQHAEAGRTWPWLACGRCGTEIRARIGVRGSG